MNGISGSNIVFGSDATVTFDTSMSMRNGLLAMPLTASLRGHRFLQIKEIHAKSAIARGHAPSARTGLEAVCVMVPSSTRAHRAGASRPAAFSELDFSTATCVKYVSTSVPSIPFSRVAKS